MAFRRLSSHRVPALLAAVLLILAQPAHRASAQKCFPQGPDAMRNQLIMSQVNPGTPEDLFLNPSLQHMVKDWSGAALKAAMAWPKAKACPAPMPGPMDEADVSHLSLSDIRESAKCPSSFSFFLRPACPPAPPFLYVHSCGFVVSSSDVLSHLHLFHCVKHSSRERAKWDRSTQPIKICCTLRATSSIIAPVERGARKRRRKARRLLP
jgi:hypothetical protein